MSPQKQKREKDQRFPGEREIEKPPSQKDPLDMDEIDNIIKKIKEIQDEDIQEGQ